MRPDIADGPGPGCDPARPQERKPRRCVECPNRDAGADHNEPLGRVQPAVRFRGERQPGSSDGRTILDLRPFNTNGLGERTNAKAVNGNLISQSVDKTPAPGA